MTTANQPISIRLETQNRENLDHLAKITKRSRSFIINDAVQKYVEDNINYFHAIEDALNDIKS